MKQEGPPRDPQTKEEVAKLLDRLADGESVSLGEFQEENGGWADDPAGWQGALLRDLAEGLRA